MCTGRPEGVLLLRPPPSSFFSSSPATVRYDVISLVTRRLQLVRERLVVYRPLIEEYNKYATFFELIINLVALL